MFSTLDSSIPVDGATNVPLAGMIRVAQRTWASSESSGTSPATPQHSVTVIDLETGAEVSGSLQPTEWNETGVYYWKPASPLRPLRRYALRQSLTQNVVRPNEAQGPTQAQSSFSTGDGKAPALNVLGGLETRTDTYEVTVCDPSRDSPGSCGCPSTHTERFHSLRVRVPAIEGDSSSTAYRVEVVVTSRTPYDFSTAGANGPSVLLHRNLPSNGQPVESLLELPVKASVAANACLAWRVIDSLGNVKEGAPECLEAPPSYVGFGCSLGADGAGPALLGVLALLRHVRRRGVRAFVR